MKNHTKPAIFILLALAVILAACSQTSAAVNPTPDQQERATSVPTQLACGSNDPSATAQSTQLACGANNPTAIAQPTQPARTSNEAPTDLALEDSQGSVTVVITPLNLNQPGATLDFDVTLNTHSVDLSMDLSQLGTLSTDTGKSMQASVWDAPMGGHHVSGILSFPATLDGISLLEGAKSLTLTLQDVDAPERKFTWDLTTPQ